MAVTRADLVEAAERIADILVSVDREDLDVALGVALDHAAASLADNPDAALREHLARQVRLSMSARTDPVARIVVRPAGLVASDGGVPPHDRPRIDRAVRAALRGSGAQVALDWWAGEGEPPVTVRTLGGVALPDDDERAYAVAAAVREAVDGVADATEEDAAPADNWVLSKG